MHESANKCGKQDPDIEPDGPVSDVEEVVLEAFAEAGVASEAVDLGPACHPGLDMLAEDIAPLAISETLDEFGTLGPGSDE